VTTGELRAEIYAPNVCFRFNWISAVGSEVIAAVALIDRFNLMFEEKKLQSQQF
jgi:hypothetical protein